MLSESLFKGRVSIHNKIKKLGFIPLTCIHPTATVSNKSLIEEGGQILAGAIISPNVKIGKSCIVNQQAVVGASTIIGEGSEIAPGALVNGEVKKLDVIVGFALDHQYFLD